jgi:CheY-like chemotaxis protein
MTNPSSVWECRFCRGGCHVLTAPDGPAGVALAHREHPDLILLDVVMPTRYDIEVCKELWADPALAATPIVLLTALTDAGMATMGA